MVSALEYTRNSSSTPFKLFPTLCSAYPPARLGMATSTTTWASSSILVCPSSTAMERWCHSFNEVFPPKDPSLLLPYTACTTSSSYVNPRPLLSSSSVAKVSVGWVIWNQRV